MPEIHPLLAHVRKFSPLEDDDWEISFTFFENLSFRKKDLLPMGTNGDNLIFFVDTGCLQQYFIDEKGTARTIQFAVENWWMGDFPAFYNRQTNDLYIQAVEDSRVCSISSKNYQRLLKDFPAWEIYFRQIFQIAYGAALNRIRYYHTFSKEELYFHFIDNFPQFAQRVPQYLIASFLNLSPEYVSELRKNRS